MRRSCKTAVERGRRKQWASFEVSYVESILGDAYPHSDCEDRKASAVFDSEYLPDRFLYIVIIRTVAWFYIVRCPTLLAWIQKKDSRSAVEDCRLQLLSK
jgi:hypothetical protein